MRSERHLRFHLFAAFCTGWLGLRFGLSRGELAALLLTFGAVIGMELLNTAIEVLTDHIMPAYHPAAKAAKDIASAAVLTAALAAVTESIVFFWRPPEWVALASWFMAHPWRIAAAVAIILVWVAFVIWGFGGRPLKSYERWVKHHRK